MKTYPHIEHAAKAIHALAWPAEHTAAKPARTIGVDMGVGTGRFIAVAQAMGQAVVPLNHILWVTQPSVMEQRRAELDSLICNLPQDWPMMFAIVRCDTGVGPPPRIYAQHILVLEDLEDYSVESWLKSSAQKVFVLTRYGQMDRMTFDAVFRQEPSS